MPDDGCEARPDSIQVLLPWGMPSGELRDGWLGEAALWLVGGAFLLVWTGIALLLTTA